MNIIQSRRHLIKSTRLVNFSKADLLMQGRSIMYKVHESGGSCKAV